MTPSPTRTFTVSGMTCDHCVASVREEVGALPGVTDVEVDLGSGRLTVHGATGEAEVRAAVEEAGYALADQGGSGSSA